MINHYTIILPHYDSLDTLSRAVSSVPDREDIEVLIIDNSREPIADDLFSERRNVSILYSPYGKGAGAARNVGLKHATGKWLLMLDADDFFTEHAFDKMDKYADSKSDIVFFRTTSCYSDTMQPSNRDRQFNELIEQYHLTGDADCLRYGWSIPWGKMIRRTLVEAHSIQFEETSVSNDVMFSLLTGYYADTVAVSDETIYCATTRQGSLTQTPSLKNIAQRIDVAIRFNRFMRAHHLPQQYKKSIMFLIYTVYQHHGWKNACRLLIHSIQSGNNPFIGISRWGQTIRKIRKNN